MEDDDTVQRCTNCQQIPEDILMLACDHDLCLNCAAMIFVAEDTTQDTRKLLTCLECGKSTELDESSVLELQKVHVELLITAKLQESEAKQHSPQRAQMQLVQPHTYTHMQQQPQQQQQRNGYDPRQNSLQLQQQQQQQQYNQVIPQQTGYSSVQTRMNSGLSEGYPSSVQKQQQQQQQQHQQEQQTMDQNDVSQQSNNTSNMISSSNRRCAEHQDEEILYFCFQCSTRCICPECVIHGAHKNHEVKTIRKAYPVIRSRVDEFQQKLSFKQKQIATRSSQLESIASELAANTDNLRKNIAMLFNDMRQKIDAKEREIMLACDQLVSKNIGEIESQTILLNDKQNEFSRIIDLVQEHVNQPDETLLLDFYATNAQRLEDIKDSREWEQQLLSSTPSFFEINARELHKALLLVESTVGKIEPLIVTDDLTAMNNFSSLSIHAVGPHTSGFLSNGDGTITNTIHRQAVLSPTSQTGKFMFEREQQGFKNSQEQSQVQLPASFGGGARAELNRQLQQQLQQQQQQQEQLQQQQQHQQQQHLKQQQTSESMFQQSPLRQDIQSSNQSAVRDSKLSEVDFERFREMLANKGRTIQQKQQELQASMAHQHTFQQQPSSASTSFVSLTGGVQAVNNHHHQQQPQQQKQQLASPLVLNTSFLNNSRQSSKNSGKDIPLVPPSPSNSNINNSKNNSHSSRNNNNQQPQQLQQWNFSASQQ